MYVVVSEEYLEQLLANREVLGGELFGQMVDGGSVIRLLYFHAVSPAESHAASRVTKTLRRTTDNVVVGRWQRGGDITTAQLQPGQLLLQEEAGQILFYRATEEGELVPQAAERLTFYKNYQSRITGLFDTVSLSSKTVAVIGLGTGGSVAAVELAKAGVGKMRLADFDRLEVHNLVRHVCGIQDLGRYKTHALKDYLLNTSPFIQVETFDIDVTEDENVLVGLLEGCDLVVGATDSEDAKAAINRVAWRLKIPAVYGAAYEMGFGGDIFTSQPNDAGLACYHCFRMATSDIFGEQPHEQIGDYGSIRPQPALSMDVGMVTLIMVRAAMGVLLKNDQTTRLHPYPSNWILWGNQPQPGWIFEEPLQSRFVDVSADPDCPICGKGASPDLLAENAELLESLSEPPVLPPSLSHFG
ncbi:MAG: ThiF family adenylyltransferase [Chloroflexota bacterium]|nr:ThiF family adenylyltransferase [Chloroflexota bacterium]